jgi:hypothetical protein
VPRERVACLESTAWKERVAYLESTAWKERVAYLESTAWKERVVCLESTAWKERVAYLESTAWKERVVSDESTDPTERVARIESPVKSRQAMKAPSEFQLQRATNFWLYGWSNLPRALSPDVIAWHTPNGGTRSAREGKAFKEAGVIPGIFDWTFVGRCTFWKIELKTEVGQLSSDQVEMWTAYQRAGAAGIGLARTLSEFKTLVIKFGLTTPEAAQIFTASGLTSANLTCTMR